MPEKDYKDLLSDDKMFGSFKDGDESAFFTVYHAFKTVIYITTINIVGIAEDAEDITVHTFQMAWERRESIQSILHLKNLLFVIARSLSINALKDRSKKDYELSDEVFGKLDDYNQDELFANLVERVNTIISQMPTLRGRIYRMRFMQELSAEEVASLLKISTSSVYDHTREAMMTLRSGLSNDNTARS